MSTSFTPLRASALLVVLVLSAMVDSGLASDIAAMASDPSSVSHPDSNPVSPPVEVTAASNRDDRKNEGSRCKGKAKVVRFAHVNDVHNRFEGVSVDRPSNLRLSAHTRAQKHPGAQCATMVPDAAARPAASSSQTSVSSLWGAAASCVWECVSVKQLSSPPPLKMPVGSNSSATSTPSHALHACNT
jgi:hypothetical protein